MARWSALGRLSPVAVVARVDNHPALALASGARDNADTDAKKALHLLLYTAVAATGVALCRRAAGL